MISVLFTSRPAIGSKLIRYLTESDCSHVAIGFDVAGKERGLVFHQSTGGLHVDSWYEFSKKYTVQHRKDFQLGLISEEDIYQDIIKVLGPVGYDYQAIIFGLLSLAGRKFLGIPLPNKNHWQNPRSFMCTGIMHILARHEPFVSIDWGHDFESMSPHGIWSKIK